MSAPVSIAPKTSKKAGLAGLIFGLIFIIAGGAFVWVMFKEPVSAMVASRTWLSTTATITESKLERSTDADGNAMYQVQISYRFGVDGKQYTGNRHSFFEIRSNLVSWKQDAVREYPQGSQRTVYYSPANPFDCVLHRGLVPDAWFGLIPLVFVLVGAAVTLGAFRGSRKERDPISLRARRIDAVPGPAATPGSRRFETPGKAVKSLIAALILTAVFITASVLVYRHVKDRIPFYFLGGMTAIFLVVSVRAFMGIFNPRPVLILDPGSPSIGERFALRWELKGGSVRCQSLKVYLKAREETSYRQGTRTYTDRNTIFEQVLFETSSPLEMSSGDCEGEIPETQMHSFKATNNKIVWELGIRGAIARWPDLDEQFAIDILPRKTK